MSTSNLSLEYATALSIGADANTVLPNIYNTNIPILDDFVLGYAAVDIDAVSLIADADKIVYAITNASSYKSLTLSGFNKLYYIINSTSFDHIVNGKVISANNSGTVLGFEHITETYTNFIAHTAFIATYAQNEQIFMGKEQKLYNIVNIEAVCEVAPTGSIQYKIYNGGIVIGSITFSSGSTIGIIALSVPLVGSNNIIKIQAPNIADATIANIGINIYMEG